jgi:hypothetical protein
MGRRKDMAECGSALVSVARGAAAGLAATLMLSALSRVLPGMGLDPKVGDAQKNNGPPPTPVDPFNHAQVEEWQQRSQAPAAFRPHREDKGAKMAGVAEWQSAEVAESRQSPTLLLPKSSTPHRPNSPKYSGGAAISPGTVLIQPESPGPEGIAEQFAYKVASAIFDTDISSIKKPVGMVTHLSYGSFWGGMYGLLRTALRTPVLATGAIFGLGVWAIGPATLVPAMKLMGKPTEEPPIRTAMMVLGHVAYGVALAEAFELEQR